MHSDPSFASWRLFHGQNRLFREPMHALAPGEQEAVGTLLALAQTLATAHLKRQIIALLQGFVELLAFHRLARNRRLFRLFAFLTN